MKNFKNEIILLLKEILLSILQMINMIFKDCKGFRNRLVCYICILGLILIISTNSQPGVQVAFLGILGTVVSYYLRIRNNKNGEDDSKK